MFRDDRGPAEIRQESFGPHGSRSDCVARSGRARRPAITRPLPAAAPPSLATSLQSPSTGLQDHRRGRFASCHRRQAPTGPGVTAVRGTGLADTPVVRNPGEPGAGMVHGTPSTHERWRSRHRPGMDQWRSGPSARRSRPGRVREAPPSAARACGRELMDATPAGDRSAFVFGVGDCAPFPLLSPAWSREPTKEGGSGTRPGRLLRPYRARRSTLLGGVAAGPDPVGMPPDPRTIGYGRIVRSMEDPACGPTGMKLDG